jgi:integrase
VDALREAIATRPTPLDQADDGLVFLQRSGLRWVRETEHSRTDNVSVQFCALLKALGLYRDGIGFYALRHVFRTIADGARDQVAIDLMMGHTDPTMGAHYRERIDNGRLVAVANHVRAWLFGDDSRPDDTDGEQEQAGPAVTEPSQTEAADHGGRPALRLFAG